MIIDKKFLLYSNSSMSWKTLNAHKNGLVKYFPSLKFAKTKESSFHENFVYKLFFMSLRSPSIAFFQSNELVEEAKVLIIVVGWIVENIFRIKEGMSQQFSDSPFTV